MCYSALVNQKVKDLGLKYQARVQFEMFEKLFDDRLSGSGAKISRALEEQFLGNEKTMAEKRISKLIRDFRSLEQKRIHDDRIVQEQRLANALKLLKLKSTKKAENDQRIASQKIEVSTQKLERLSSAMLTESDSRIFPGNYAPLITMIAGEKVIAPFRYLLRPASQAPEFDRKYNGAYNVRRDSLDRVFWWRNLFGKHHAFMEIESFWENVKKHDFEKRELKKNEEPENIVLKFTPDGLSHMVIPCIYDYNDRGDYPLQSFALITDEPNPEVAAVGHDRTPVIMREKYLDLWLKTEAAALETYLPVFEDKMPTYLEHSLAA